MCGCERRAAMPISRRNLSAPTEEALDRVPVREGIGEGSRGVAHGGNIAAERVARPSSSTLEELHCALVLLCRGQALECAQIAPLAGLRVLLSGVEAVPARLQL